MRSISDKICRENQNISYAITFSRIVPVIGKYGKEIGRAKQAADDNIKQRMRITCLITKATDTHSRVCNTYCFFMANTVSRTGLNVALIRTFPHLLSYNKTDKMMQ
jgi:hypothetical protein